LAVGAFTLLLLGLACGHPGGPSASQTPISATPEWFASNGPLLAEYLRTLPPTDIGKPLRGIRLAGEGASSRWLEGQTYLGVPGGIPAGVGVRLIDDGRRVVAYVWVEHGGGEYVLEPCESGEQEGIRARRAGGGPYAWKALKPEHGLVYTVCPPEDWIPDDAPSTRPAGPTG
jgi:hypothetical protein